MQISGEMLVKILVGRLDDLGKRVYDSNIVWLLRQITSQELNQAVSFGDVTEWHNERIYKRKEVKK